ncbi:MAG TPA: LITAF-like zinc ribbon domain-containing protein [Pyrinomonadaceae bacterium]|nr:LITAF-like zinc ribbon domain-containing protein [Pyrinomonadaceae bacterium]
MIRCDACRTLNDDNARSCIGCGTSLWLTGRAPTSEIKKEKPVTQQRPPAYTPPSYDAYAPPATVQPAASGIRPQPQLSGYRCPYCHSTAPPFSIEKISDGGWIVFAVMLLFCFPLFWIGLLMKDNQQFCSTCRARIG